MSTFFQIASRVKAAVEAYISVQDFVDRQEWKAKFKRVEVSGHYHGIYTVFDHFAFQIEKCYL